jgi:hypothetical protein
MDVKINPSKIIYQEILPCGGVFIVRDKPRIEHLDGKVTGLCLDLRKYYERCDKGSGKIKRLTRSDKEVINLSKAWLNRLRERGEIV